MAQGDDDSAFLGGLKTAFPPYRSADPLTTAGAPSDIDGGTEKGCHPPRASVIRGVCAMMTGVASHAEGPVLPAGGVTPMRGVRVVTRIETIGSQQTVARIHALAAFARLGMRIAAGRALV